MSEQNMRGRVVRALRPLHGIAVENPALPGTPDVNYVEGWIELKWLREWPINEETIVRFEHFTPQQRVWHIKRRMAGGVSWVLVQCKKEWLLFDGAVAAMHLNQCPRASLYEVAEAYSTDGFNEEELKRWISRRQSVFSLNEDERDKLKSVLRSGTGFPLADMLRGKEE